MEMQWEEFEPGPALPSAEHIYVTINPKGHLYLNSRTIKALGEPDAVVLMYDRRKQAIGIKRAPLDRRNAYRLRKKDGPRTGGRMIYTANFCRHHHIRPDKTLAFTAAEVDKNGVLILSMHEVRSARRK